MQLANVKVDVNLHNVVAEPRKARVNTNSPKFFRIMSDGIYQDKIGSIVRELSCNALDSHIVNGNREVPFQLHIPTELEPYFTVTDYGIGLDHQGVEDTYLGYLESTKDTSNECIGAFGLGAKTPFSYADSFTVTATKDGVRRIYSAFIGDDGSPAVVPMGDAVATTEPNGVEVMVPVTDVADFAKFSRAVSEQLRFFKVKPTITNATIEFDVLDVLDAANGVSLLQGAYGRNKNIWIVQGGVGYPMNYSTVSQYLSKDALQFLDFINQTGGILEFPIGRIETTASREGVSYSKFTIASIEALLIETGSTLIDNMVAKVAAMDTEWAKGEFLNANPVIGAMMESKGAGTVAGLVPNLIQCAIGSPLTSWGLKLNTSKMQASRYKRKLSRRARKPQYELSQSNVTEYRANSHSLIAIADTMDKPVARLRQFMAVNAGLNGECKALEIAPLQDATIADITAIFDTVGITYTLMSTIVLPPRVVVRTNSTYAKPSCYSRRARQDKNDATDWGKVTNKIKEMTDGGYYVVIPEGSRFSVRSLPSSQNFIYALADAGELDKDIFAIRERELKRVVNNPEWVALEVIAQDYIDQYKDNVKVAAAIAADNALSTDNATATLIRINTDAMIAKGYAIPAVFEHYNKIVRLHTKVANGTDAMNDTILGIIKSHNADYINAQETTWNERNRKAKNAIFAAFPFLNYVSTRTYRDPETNERSERYEPGIADHLAEYINRFS